MFDYLNNIEYGKNIITEIDGKNKDMLMDISLVKIAKGDEIRICSSDKETAILHLTGRVKITFQNSTYTSTRNSLFDEEGFCIHLSRDKEVIVFGEEESEVIMQQAENHNDFETVVYDKGNIRSDIFGENVAGGTCRRIVRTIFDYNNATYSNMVMGEVITYPGRWSSYPPHHHPQPEAYFYRFDKEQGFGASFIGEDAFKIKNNSIANIPGGLVHPQTSAPGYAMYYCWMIRHLKNNPWTSRIDDEAHTWIMDKDANIWQGK